MLKLSKSKHDLKNWSTIFGPELALSIRKKSEHDLAKSEHDFAQKNKNKTYFCEPDLIPINEGYFYYINIDIVLV